MAKFDRTGFYSTLPPHTFLSDNHGIAERSSTLMSLILWREVHLRTVLLLIVDPQRTKLSIDAEWSLHDFFTNNTCKRLAMRKWITRLVVTSTLIVAGIYWAIDKDLRQLLVHLPTDTDVLFWSTPQRDAAFRAMDRLPMLAPSNIIRKGNT